MSRVSNRQVNGKKNGVRRKSSTRKSGLHPSLRQLLAKAIAEQQPLGDQSVIRIIRASDEEAESVSPPGKKAQK